MPKVLEFGPYILFFWIGETENRFTFTLPSNGRRNMQRKSG